MTARDISAPDHLGALSVLAAVGDTCELCIEACARALEPEPVETLGPVCSSCHDYTVTGADGFCDRCRDAETVEPVADTYAAAVELAETRPDPCAECGHPSHGATCATCDDAAQVGTYSPCADVASIPRGHIGHVDWYRAAGAERCAYCGDVEPAPVEPEPSPAAVEPDWIAELRASMVEPIAEPVSAPAPVQPASRPTCERCGQVFRVKGAGAEWHRVNRPDCARIAVAV